MKVSFQFQSLCLLYCTLLVPFGNAFVVPAPASFKVASRVKTVVRSTPNKRGGGGEEALPRIDDLPGPEDTTDASIRSLFVLFNCALATQNPKLVIKRYANEAVLHPSSNKEPLMDTQAIEAFYAKYLLERPQKRILEGRVRVGRGWAEDAGVCEITTHGGKATKARYSFVYVWEGNQWKILHHHTSCLGAVDVSSSPSLSNPGGPMTKQRVENLFQLLQDAFDIKDPELVARRFCHDALFLPLDVYKPHKHGYQQIKEYFEEFLLDKPSISKVEQVLLTVDNAIQPKWAKDTGTLQVKFQTDGSTLHARYSIDYLVDEAGVWKIAQFILSPLPNDWNQLRTVRRLPSIENYNDKDFLGSTTTSTTGEGVQVTSPPTVTEEQVRSWFGEWNAAMATGDPEAVANRYATDAVMMTTASATPKSTPEEIQEFYQMFLWNRPKAKVLQSLVTTSTHWCKDVGVLEYTMNRGEQRIRERYSFLYVYDDATGWKIAHHHSAVFVGDLTESGPEIRGDENSEYFQ